MSIAGILGGNLFNVDAAKNALQTQGTQSNTPRFEQITKEFQQLGQDLQSGNLTQAQADFATLSSNLPGGKPSQRHRGCNDRCDHDRCYDNHGPSHVGAAIRATWAGPEIR